MSDLNWKGYALKKAFKTASKNNWKKRFIVFNSDKFTIQWYDSEKAYGSGTAKGEFKLDPHDLFVDTVEEHDKPNELRVSSLGHSLYLSFEAEDKSAALAKFIDAARRNRVASIETSAEGFYVYKTDKEVAATHSSSYGAQRSVYTWGAGQMLGSSRSDVSGIALPQLVSTVSANGPIKSLSTGPEHVAVVTENDAVFLWGSNDFYQLAQSADVSSSLKPVPVMPLSIKRVLQVACGGSHTLAIVSDANSTSKYGALFAWGTGTVGQLGLGQNIQILDAPAVVGVPDLRRNVGVSVVRECFAGLVSSGCITATGETFLWGDASMGRLGLSDVHHPNQALDQPPQLVNAAVVWTPTQLKVSRQLLGVPAQLPTSKPAHPVVVSMALGGSFSLFLVAPPSIYPDGATQNLSSMDGCILLVSGCLGLDITKDAYAIPDAEDKLEDLFHREYQSVARNVKTTPAPISPFGLQPVVLSVAAGARHAAVVALAPATSSSSQPSQAAQPLLYPRVFTAGKGWLAHEGTIDTTLLPPPSMSESFFAVSGQLQREAAVGVACGHSHTIVRTASGKMYSWGRGDNGELGLGNLSDRTVPAVVRDVPGLIYLDVAAGSYYSAAIVGLNTGAPVDINAAVSQVRKNLRNVVVEIDECVRQTEESIAMLQAAAQAATHAATQAVQNNIVNTSSSNISAAEVENPKPVKLTNTQRAQAEAKKQLALNELPPNWNWDETPEGEIYFERPDGETQWEDPRDDWEFYWRQFL